MSSEGEVGGRQPILRLKNPFRNLTILIALTSLTVSLTGGLPARAAGIVLGFDDLGVPPGGRTIVNTYYSTEGVTFNNVSAIDYSQPPYPAGFAHSGTVGIEQCYAVEFCSSPIRANFTVDQQTVKVWVGQSFSLSSPLTVRLTAFDANHNSVGIADVTLPANAAPTPIQDPLSVSSPTATIRSLEVSVPGGYMNGVAVDDVEFSAAGPPPPCDATSVPTVQVTEPASGLMVRNNEFLFEGSVDPGGAPIESAFIMDNGQSASRTATLYPSLISASGGPFGPVRFNGLLFQGENKLIVTATNCLGTGASGVFDVAWEPLPPNTSFRLLGLEVTQGVQSASNTVPLIAAAASSFKRTLVRVYLGVAGVSLVRQVSGRLTASRPDGSLPGGPATIPSLNSITVDAAGTLETARASLETSLNFELPQAWLGAGRLHLQLDHLDIEGARSTFPCIGCDNPGLPVPPGPPSPALVWFHTVPPLRIWLVGVPYMTGPTTTIMPRQFDFDMLVSWLRRTYPSADVQITQASMGSLASPPTTCTDVNTALTQWAATMPGQDPTTRYYGLIPDNSTNNFVGGCSSIPELDDAPTPQFGSGPAGVLFPESNPWDTDGSYADAYGGHEIAHMYGRRHPGFCAGQDRADPNYPYPGGLLGTSVFDFQGWDGGDGSLGLSPQLNDWRAGWHDVMTYCRFQWMSNYTYRGILQKLCADDLANCPDNAVFGVGAGGSSSVARRAPRKLVSVTGTVEPGTGEVVLGPLWVRSDLTASKPVPDGAYSIDMKGAGGRLLARHRFEPQEMSDPLSSTAATALINEVVPFPAKTRRIVVTMGSRTLTSVRVSAHAPSVHLISPNGGETLGSQVQVRWRSRDRDGGRRVFTLLYSPDGERFIPVASGLRGTSVSVNLKGLPGGTQARFKVLASDGVRTGSDRSDGSFAVPVKPPRVSITAPTEQADLVEGRLITFFGTATDPQDGSLPASSLVWSSSLQGQLGTGSSVTVALQPGTHVITFRATNQASGSAVAMVTLTVHALPPVVFADIVP
jgi:hypothetical protein